MTTSKNHTFSLVAPAKTLSGLTDLPTVNSKSKCVGDQPLHALKAGCFLFVVVVQCKNAGVFMVAVFDAC